MKSTPRPRPDCTYWLFTLAWLATTHAAMAAPYFWQGPSNGNWFDAGNWSPQGLPADTDMVTIDEGRSAVVGAPGAVGSSLNLGTGAGGGILSVQGGGTGTTSGLSVNGGSTFTVTGIGSAWTVNGSFNAQEAGATVLVSAGGTLTSNAANVNDYFDYSANLTITGTGTSWTSRGFVTLYTGTFNFLDQATISTGRVSMGLFDDNIAILNAGGGAQWTASSVVVGSSSMVTGLGTSTLNLTESANLTTTANQPNAIRIGSFGRVNIGTGGVAGTITTAGITFTPAGGVLSFNHTNDVVLSAPVTGTGQILKDGSGTTTLAAVSTYTGPTIITEGTVHLTGSASGSDFTVGLDGRLSGNGTAGPVDLEAGGLLTPGASFSAPGGSAGLLTIGSGSTFAGDITLEIGGLTRGSLYDAINVSGAGLLTLGGELSLSFINGFTPGVGDSFLLFNAADLSGSFAQINLPAIPSGEWDTTQLGTTGVVAVVPEPTAFSLLAGAALLLARRRSRCVHSLESR